MASPSVFDILILGAGIAGLATSIGLRQKGHQVTVLESASSLRTLGGSLLVPPPSARVLDDFGVWGKFMEQEAVPPGNTTFRYSDGCILESVDYVLMEQKFGYPTMAISRVRYQRLLYDAAISVGVVVRLGCRATEINESIPSVTLASGETLSADLVIGADGIKSKVRAAILSPNSPNPIPESMAYQCLVSGSSMLADALTAPLMQRSAIHSWYGPGAQMISGASSNGSSYSFTLIIYPPSLSSPPSSSPDNDILVPNSATSFSNGDVESMRKAVSGFEERVRRFVGMVKEEECNLWKIGHLPTLSTWTSPGGRVTLVGDAAHAMVPHLGMGAATAVEDAGVLSLLLSPTHCPSAAQIPTALKKYEMLRKPRTAKIQAAALVAGKYKAMPDGADQEERDRKMRERMDPHNPKYEFWRAAGGLAWLYDYDFAKEVKSELQRDGKGARL